MAGLRLTITLILFSISGNAGISQQPIKPGEALVKAGFYTGKQYMDLEKSEREIYASGLFDGLMASGWLGAKESSVTTIHDCIPALTSDQFAAILDKYLADHPERWNVPMSVIAAEALSKTCGKRAAKEI